MTTPAELSLALRQRSAHCSNTQRGYDSALLRLVVIGDDRGVARRVQDAVGKSVSFDVAADFYDRFMGRFSEPLALQFAQLAAVRPGQRVLDVGCGPGALTAQLAQRLGSGGVSAIDPSASFVAAIRDRFPEISVQRGIAERLPFADRTFDPALAQLVVHFMADPVAGLAEMARVTRPGGSNRRRCSSWAPSRRSSSNGISRTQ